MREIGDRANLLRRINRTVFGRLGDRDRTGLDVMLVSDVMQVLANAGHRDLPVWRGHSQQLAPDVFLRRRAFGRINVRGLRADHGLMRLHHAMKAENVRSGAAEDEEYLGIFAEQGTDPLFGLVGVRIFAV